MFGSIGWQEILVLLIVALLIFGPDKLPGAAKQASEAMKGVKKQVTGARQSVQQEFGDVVPPGFDRTMLNPRSFVKKHLWDDDPADSATAAAPVRPMQFDTETT